MKGGTPLTTSPPSIYEHLTADEQRLELERVREELRSTKKQLTERDAEILQLTTAHRKLQDALRKKDKDLQNVFGVLRAPQDAELTKKRKAELVERLLMETQQRLVNAEAIADERKRELDKLKFSSKFLGYQELDVEIEECHREIERLRSQLRQYSVVGKLKISKTDGRSGFEKTVETKQKSAIHQGHANQHERVTYYRDQIVRPIGQDTLVPDAPAPANTTVTSKKRPSFVDKTRRRAVEAEYQKQVRLAQLEAECELEENLRILAKREAAAQAEMRRQKRQDDKRSSRTASGPAVVVVVASAQEIVPQVNDDRVNTDKDSNSSPNLVEVGASTVILAGGRGAVESEAKEQVPAVVEITSVETTTSLDPPELSAVVAEEPRLYDEEGFDADRDDENDVDRQVTAVPETNHEVEKIDEDDGSEVEPAIRDEAEAADSPRSDPPPVVSAVHVETVEEDEDSEDHQREEVEPPVIDSLGEEEKEDDAPANEPDLPQQGFLLDPVNNVELPSDLLLVLPTISHNGVDSEAAKPIHRDLSTVDDDPNTLAVVEPDAPAEYSDDDDVGADKDGNDEQNETARQDSSTNHDLPSDDDLVAGREDTKQASPEGGETESPRESALTPDSDEQTPRSLSEDPRLTVAPAEEQPQEQNLLLVAAEVCDEKKRKPTMDTTAHAEEVHEAVEETLHACDDAMAAASELISHQIDAALAESTIAAMESASQATTESGGGSNSNTLSSQELALAMDAAARKIQQFWREMAATYTTPRARSPPPHAETSAVEEPLLGVADETDVASEHDGATTPELIPSSGRGGARR